MEWVNDDAHLIQRTLNVQYVFALTDQYDYDASYLYLISFMCFYFSNQISLIFLEFGFHLRISL